MGRLQLFLFPEQGTCNRSGREEREQVGEGFNGGEMICRGGAVEPEGGDTQLSRGVNVVLKVVTDHEELMRGKIQLFEHATIEAE